MVVHQLHGDVRAKTLLVEIEPLSIDLQLPPSRARAILPILSQHRHRWRHLAVTGLPFVLRSVVRHIGEEESQLESLSLCSRSHVQIELEHLRLPHLRSFSVYNLEAAAAAETLANLQHIHLAATPKPTYLHLMLCHCVALTALELDLGSGTPDTDEPPAFSPIRLSELKTFRIICLEMKFYIRLLHSIDMPGVQRFYLRGGTYTTSDTRPPFLHEILWDNERIPVLIASVLNKYIPSHLVVSTTKSLFQVVGDDVLTLAVGYPTYETYTVLTRASVIFQLGSVPVILKINLDSLKFGNWRKLLASIHLVSLHGYVGHPDELRSLCELLGQMPSSCPHLTCLRLFFEGPLVGEPISKTAIEPVVRDMLQNRRRMTVELGEHEVFNLSAGKFQRKPGGRSSSTDAEEKREWKFTF